MVLNTIATTIKSAFNTFVSSVKRNDALAAVGARISGLGESKAYTTLNDLLRFDVVSKGLVTSLKSTKTTITSGALTLGNTISFTNKLESFKTATTKSAIASVMVSRGVDAEIAGRLTRNYTHIELKKITSLLGDTNKAKSAKVARLINDEKTFAKIIDVSKSENFVKDPDAVIYLVNSITELYDDVNPIINITEEIIEFLKQKYTFTPSLSV